MKTPTTEKQTSDAPPRSLDPVVRALVDALDEVTACPTCNGRKTWKPECYACLCGEPEKCTCATVEYETCPQCNGTGRDFADSEKAEKMIALYCPNGPS